MRAFFIPEKNLKIFQKRSLNHTFHSLYGAERGINTFQIIVDYQQGLKRRKDKEIPFCELPEIFVENFAVWDDYETDYTIFSVCGIDIRVLDDELAEALKKLPERKRNTLLMYYFLEMTESEIANLQKITQSGVFRNRHHALETMKKILKEEH